VLVAMYYPHQVIILFIFPLPLWLLATFLVLVDIFDFLQSKPGDHVAHVVHLAGAGVGALYRYIDLRLTTVLATFRQSQLRRNVRRAQKRPERDVAGDGIPRFIEDVENQRLDRILAKISEFGQDSLTEDEVEFLNRMSERYRGGR
jgi:hypothetical protein